MIGGLFLTLALAFLPPSPQRDSFPVVVASKPFGESYLLAEMFAQVLESRGVQVVRRPGLAATELLFRALQNNSVDVYPEYTGTGLLAILKEPAVSDSRAVYLRVAREFSARWDLHWLPPLGFENTYAIAVRRETAEREKLATLSDLARAAPGLRAGFSPDFLGRPDGLPGLATAYGLRFRETRSLLQSVKYRALAAGDVDIIDGYSTDGLIARYDLVVLRDDRAFFPPYEAAALVSARLSRYPEAVAALSALSGKIDVARMRTWNQRVEVSSEAVSAVATDALRELGLGTGRSAADRTSAGDSTSSSLIEYFLDRRSQILRLALRHLLLVVVCVGAAVLIAVPLGLLLERSAGRAESVIRAVGLLQTIPGIALLAFMIPLLGVGIVPALTALFLYSLYPILRNTYTGVSNADPAAVNASLSLGMTPRQVLVQIRLPLAAPIILAGIRTAAVLAVGTATLAAFIGAGGLGDPIVAGLALSDTRMILLGAVPAALLALIVDVGLGLVERAVTPVYQRGR
jgi:osmoprotectant transport system permease protein